MLEVILQIVFWCLVAGGCAVWFMRRKDHEFKGEDGGYRVVNLTFEWLYGSALLSGACLGLFGFVKLIKWMLVA